MEKLLLYPNHSNNVELPKDPVKFKLAHFKLDNPNGMRGNVSCGVEGCMSNSVHILADCIESETEHEALNLLTGKMEKHYKLSYLCPKTKKEIYSAVVWNHDVGVLNATI